MVRNFGGLSARSQRIALVLLAISVPLAAWRTWLHPERLLLDARRAARASAIADLARLQRAADALPQLTRDVRALEATLQERTGTGSPGPVAVTLLEALHDFAADAGLDLVSFAHATASPGATAANQRFQFTVEGSFHGIVAFLASLHASGRVAAATDVAIKPSSKPSSHALGATIVAEINPAGTAIAIPELQLERRESPESKDTNERNPFAPRVQIARASGSAATGDVVPRAGLAGISAGEVIVTGIARAGDAVSAVLQTTDRRTFVVRPHDELRDAVVKSIDSTGVVFLFRRSPEQEGRRPEPGPRELRTPVGKSQGVVR